ncbi:MAG: DUF4268 domain-containing protein [Crocinitomicaceae bacterium]|nr:DUF4268 domain-containing protein [Crocinitomicaceae bacterium]
MLSKEELKNKNSEFWEQFRKEIKDQRSTNGRQMNWINYPTDIKDAYVRMEVDSKGARLCFDIQPKDDGIRAIIWEQMTELKKVMTDTMGIEAEWIEESHIWNGRMISRIKWEDDTFNFFNEEDIPKINAFLKDKLIRFDAFYQQFKEILINLTS